MAKQQQSPSGAPQAHREKDLDEALKATFPASDPVSLHGDDADDKAKQSPDQSLQSGSQKTGESAGSGGQGRPKKPGNT